MHDPQHPIVFFVVLVSIFFIMLIVVIIITALLYHSRKKLHQIEVANFQNVLLQARLEASEQTMQTIGSDLHDNIGQLLSLVALTLGAVDTIQDGVSEKKIDTAIDLTNRSIQELRHLGKLIQGEQLLETGLYEAVTQVADWVQRSGRYQVNLKMDRNNIPVISKEKELIVFRVLQEALNNIVKHAQASQIDISFETTRDLLTLIIEDNGVGFTPAASEQEQKGMGLFNMFKRTEALGGHCTIRSVINKGSNIQINIPYS